jgi:hypothetical protein
MNLKIQHQIKFLLAVSFVNIRKISKVAVLVVIHIFKSKAEIAEKFDCNSGFEYADDFVSSRSDSLFSYSFSFIGYYRLRKLYANSFSLFPLRFHECDLLSKS